MTNEQIIFEKVCNLLQIDEEEGKALVFSGRFPAYHTYQAWQDLGYQVQKGQKAAFSAKIWKMTERKDEDGKKSQKMIMKTAYFFSAEQVARAQ